MVLITRISDAAFMSLIQFDNSNHSAKVITYSPKKTIPTHTPSEIVTLVKTGNDLVSVLVLLVVAIRSRTRFS